MNSSQVAYQPRYKARGPEKPRNEKCNFCGLDGHFERECDLCSILDRMKITNIGFYNNATATWEVRYIMWSKKQIPLQTTKIHVILNELIK